MKRMHIWCMYNLKFGEIRLFVDIYQTKLTEKYQTKPIKRKNVLCFKIGSGKSPVLKYNTAYYLGSWYTYKILEQTNARDIY